MSVRSFQQLVDDHEKAQEASKPDAAVALLISLGYQWNGQQWVKST